MLVILCFASSAIVAQEQLVIEADGIFDGTTLQWQKAVVIEGGVIKAILPKDDPAIPKSAKKRAVFFLMPGLVMAGSNTLVNTKGLTRSITPGVRATDGFDPFEKRPAILRGGVTLAYVSPG